MIQGQSTEAALLPNPPLRASDVTDPKREPLTNRA
jgi:hypothetical protein